MLAVLDGAPLRPVVPAITAAERGLSDPTHPGCADDDGAACDGEEGEGTEEGERSSDVSLACR